MMSLKEFVEELAGILPKELKAECSVKLKELEEYYGRIPYRILFLGYSKDRQSLALTVNPENYYEDYFSGQRSVKEIGEEIRSFYEKFDEEFILEREAVENYDKAKKYLSFAFINRHRNEAVLKELVHIDYGDISLIYRLVFQKSDQKKNVSSVKITKRMIQKWGVLERELNTDAFMSAPNITPARLLTLDEVMCECFDVPHRGDGQANMYVLTNSIMQNGSGVILYKGIGEMIRNKTGKKDFFVLPSSVHELLLVPMDMGVSYDELKKMVEEVNREEITVEDYLSDSIFVYNVETEEFMPYEKEGVSHEVQ